MKALRERRVPKAEVQIKNAVAAAVVTILDNDREHLSPPHYVEIGKPPKVIEPQEYMDRVQLGISTYLSSLSLYTQVVYDESASHLRPETLVFDRPVSLATH